jgi:uncharacterized protein (UPF0333 family)
VFGKLELKFSGLTIGLIIAVVVLAAIVVLIYFFAFDWFENTRPAGLPKILLQADRLG